MNNINEFLKLRLQNLTEVFNKILCRYEYDSMSDAHYIQIIPNSQFTTEDLREEMANLMYEFYDAFPLESLVFLTENDHISLASVDFIVRGVNYKPTWECFIDGAKKPDLKDQVQGEPNYALAA